MIKVMDNGFQKLDTQALAAQAQLLKKAIAKKRGDEAYKPKNEYDYKDFSHLTARNLETEMWIDGKSSWIDDESYSLVCRKVPRCGECQDGWIITRTDYSKAPTSKICRRCEVPRRWMNRLNKLELPLDAVGMHLDAYEPDSPRQVEVISNMLDYLNRGDGAPPAVLCYGPPGNGKTSILYAVAREACNLHWKVRYTSHTQIMNDIQGSWNDKNKSNPVERWLDGVEILLLDEWCGIGGSAMKQGWWVKQSIELTEQIHRRWKAGTLAVIMTTNVYPKQMFDIFNNNAFQSRFLGMFHPCEMKGRDRRKDNLDLTHWGL